MIFEDIWPVVQPHTVLNKHKVRNIYTLLSNLLLAPLAQAVDLGDVGECGVYRGGVSLMMAMMVDRMTVPRRVFMFDSFQGLPALNSNFDLPFYEQNTLCASMREVSDLLSKHALLDHTEIRPGWFEETLASLPSDQRFCFLHVDCDLYDSTKTCLHHLYDKVVDGGIIVFDDYFDIGAGERKAVDEFLAEHGNELLFAGPTEQVFFFKGRQTFPKNRPSLLTLPEGTVVSLAFLADNTEYLDDLKKDVLMPELRGGSLGKAAELARQTLKIYNYHQSVLQRLEKA